MAEKEKDTVPVDIPLNIEIMEEEEEDVKEKFKRWMQENITACLVVEHELAKLAETTNALQIRPDILYMHLKVMQLVIEEQVFKDGNTNVSEEWKVRKKDADDIIAFIVEESMNVHDLLKKYMKEEGKKQYIQGYG